MLRTFPCRRSCPARSEISRAVAGECGAYIELVSGPALLSKWLGQTEAALRAVFERARKLAHEPSTAVRSRSNSA